MNYVIGVDIGTTHTKAVVVTADGKVCEEEKAGYAISQPVTGYSEQDPAEIFAAVLSVLKKVLARINDKSELKGICFSAAMHSIMAIDGDGKPLTPLLTWADTRSNKYALQLKKGDQAQSIYFQTGTPIHPMSPLCKIAWIRNETPDVFARTHKFISCKEYVFYRLFGKYLIDHSLASSTGMFNIHTLEWSDEALQAIGITAGYLSQPVSPLHVETALNEQYRKELELDTEVPFIVGASDGGLANLGSGAILPGEASITIGTSGAVRTLVKQPFKDVKARLFNYILSENWFITGGGINNGGIVLKWFVENMLDKEFSSNEAFDWFMQCASKSPIASNGLLFLPYVFGERAPVWDADATGIFQGINGSHAKEHFMRAILEGISFTLYQVLGAIEEMGNPIQTVYASGGFIASDFWLQMLSDIVDKKVIVSHSADASAMGAAFMALYAGGLMKDWKDVKAIIVNSAEFEPDHAAHEKYMVNFNKFQTLYARNKDI